MPPGRDEACLVPTPNTSPSKGENLLPSLFSRGKDRMEVNSALRVIYHISTNDLKNIPEEARWAEDIGYDGLSVEETAHDPFSALMLAATTTSRVTLETRVAIAFPRSPMVVAQSARDLQDFSGGRFRLGLGTQVKGHMERRFSVPWVSPGPRLREYIQALHAIWDTWQEDTPLNFQGRFYNFSLMTPFFSPGAGCHPKPLWLSAPSTHITAGWRARSAMAWRCIL